jgi:hypothetical protein
VKFSGVALSCGSRLGSFCDAARHCVAILSDSWRIRLSSCFRKEIRSGTSSPLPQTHCCRARPLVALPDIRLQCNSPTTTAGRIVLCCHCSATLLPCHTCQRHAPFCQTSNSELSSRACAKSLKTGRILMKFGSWRSYLWRAAVWEAEETVEGLTFVPYSFSLHAGLVTAKMQTRRRKMSQAHFLSSFVILLPQV